MSTTSQPKASMRTKLPNGDFLSLTVWAGKTDPTAEVITVQIRHPESDQWETIGRMAAYRTSDGKYSQLPNTKTNIEVSTIVYSYLTRILSSRIP
jgi:hypothetical protein